MSKTARTPYKTKKKKNERRAARAVKNCVRRGGAMDSSEQTVLS